MVKERIMRSTKSFRQKVFCALTAQDRALEEFSGLLAERNVGAENYHETLGITR